MASSSLSSAIDFLYHRYSPSIPHLGPLEVRLYRVSTASRDHAVYPISVAAELSGVRRSPCGSTRRTDWSPPGGPLVGPGATAPTTCHIDRITALIGHGLNLAGAGMVLALETENGELRTQNAGLRTQNEELRASMPGASTDDPPNTTAKGDSHDQ